MIAFMMMLNTGHQTWIKSISEKMDIGAIHNNKKNPRLLQKACKIRLGLDETFLKCRKQK